MRINRIEVRAFRKLRHFVVEGLSPGLNVIVGDNEAGKSTLLAALRAVLFERHRVGGKVVGAMLPHGHDVRPEVTLDFTVKGGAFRLRKAFNQRPEAELTQPDGQTVTGDAVEERLAALLSFEAPGNRGSRPEEHQGIYGLLWVDQGLAHGPLNAGAGQSSLAAALESEVGLVLGGERGRYLLQQAEERRDAFWSRHEKPSPRGAFRAVQDEVAALEGQRGLLAQRLAAHDEKVAALATRVETLARHARDDRLAVAVRSAEAARAAALQARQLEATLMDVRRAEAAARAAHEAAAERLKARQVLSDRAAAGALAVSRASEQRRDAQAALQRAADVLQRAAAVLAETREHRQATDARLAIVETAIARRKAREDLAQAQKRLADVAAVAVRRRAALAVVQGIAITKARLAELDGRAAARDLARSRRDAASVQIGFEPLAATDLTVDGAPHPVALPLLLSRDATLDLPGFGRLRVRPGGGVEPLARAVREAEDAFEAQLRKLGHASRQAAADALARKSEAEAEVSAQDRLMAILAPDGIEAVRAAADKLAAEGAPADDDPTAPPSDEERRALHRDRSTALAAEAQAEADATQADKAREAAATQAAVVDERSLAASREAEASAHALASARAIHADDRLAGMLAETRQAVDLAASATDTAATALATADPETLALELRRAEQAEAAIRADIERLTREKRDFEVELTTLGRDGIGEQLAEVDGKLAAAHGRLARQTIEAEASLLLQRTLAAAQRETKDRWLGPVRERVRPYLRLIQPGSDIVLNERTFGIEHLVRDGVSEPFASLSVGAREQVAVITRLALADILRAAGHPSAIILDDALVNTDETRLGAMHLVLQKAAENLQVLVLTCRERDFVGLGAPIHRL